MSCAHTKYKKKMEKRKNEKNEKNDKDKKNNQRPTTNNVPRGGNESNYRQIKDLFCHVRGEKNHLAPKYKL